MGLFDLSERTALVTGGGRGIGRAIAGGLAEHGARVVVGDVDEETGEEAARALRAAGAVARFVGLDVTDPGAIERVLDTCDEELDGLDILVNNAGMSQRTPAERYADSDLQRIIDINLKGVFFGMRAAARRWIEAGRGGNIINLASFAGIRADPRSAPYAATKGGVVQLTRTCAVEWGRHRIRVNAIGPGYTRTAMTEPALGEADTREAVLARTPLGRVAEPADLAGAAIFLASGASDHVTGHLLMVDGGWSVT